MPGDRHFYRIDIVEIKILLRKKIGSKKAEKYFDLLNNFLALKLRKPEFNKLCVTVIGRDNISLHNRLITSILKNACLSKKSPLKGNKFEGPVIDRVSNGYQRSCLQSLCRDALPLSPRRERTSGIRDRKTSPLGPYGKPNAVGSCKDLGQKTLEQQSPTELLSLGSRPIEVTSVEDGEEVDQAAMSPGIHSRSPVTPPLGIPLNWKGTRKMLTSLSPSSVHVETCLGNGELPNTSSLRKRLEEKLEQEGLGISLDCVNLLNNGLDCFLKRLVKPSLELVSSRSEKKRLKMGFESYHGPNSSVSLLDFRASMEMNPQLLGEDWPIQFEKVCLREFESRVGD